MISILTPLEEKRIERNKEICEMYKKLMKLDKATPWRVFRTISKRMGVNQQTIYRAAVEGGVYKPNN